MYLKSISFFHLLTEQQGKVNIGICLTKGNLEVEVISAKDICPPDAEEPGKVFFSFSFKNNKYHRSHLKIKNQFIVENQYKKSLLFKKKS